jgi:hypothetical protein
MVKIVLKLCGTLRIITYHHVLQLTSKATNSIDADLMVTLPLSAAPLIYQYSMT